MVLESSEYGEFSFDEFEILFQNFDKNGDGVIDKNEMKMFLLDLVGFNHEEFEEKQSEEYESSADNYEANSIEAKEGEEDVNLIKLSFLYVQS